MKTQSAGKAVVTILGALLLVPCIAEAQETFAEAISVRVVEVPVTVVNRAGESVRGLSAANFQVSDNGRKARIAYFETIDTTVPTPAKERRANPATTLYSVLLFDLTNSSAGNIERASEAARSFVRERMGPANLMAVATYSVEHGFRMLTSFTSDRDLLDLAIETLGDPRYFRIRDPLLLSASGVYRSAGLSAATERHSTGKHQNVATSPEWEALSKDFDRMNRQMGDQYVQGRLKTQMEGLGSLARLLDEVRGRKQVILLSEGFDARLIQGVGLSAEESVTEGESAIRGEVWRIDNDYRYGYTGLKTILQDMAVSFRRSDVVLHAMDIRGVRADVDAKEGLVRENNDSLFLLTSPTGGAVFKNANDLGDNFDRLAKTQELVYVIGFYAQPTGKAGSYHEIEVDVVDASAARVTHRPGYYELSDEIDPMRTRLTAADILLNDIEHDEVGVDMLTTGFRHESGEYQIPVVVEIGGRSILEWAPGDDVEVDIFVYAFDRAGAVRDHEYRTVRVLVPQTADILSQSGLKYYACLTLPPGLYDVKILVEIRGTEARGFAKTTLNLPEAGEARILPPLVMEDEGRWIMIKAEPRNVIEVPYPFHVGGESFVPAVTPVIRPNSVTRAALFGSGINFDLANIRAGVRNSSGQVEPNAAIEVLGLDRDPESGLEKLLIELTLGEVLPGDYYLDIAIEQGDSKLAQTIRLDVRG